MDLRTKLVFSLVAVSLASMLVLGAFAYGVARDQLRDLAVRQLEAVAESKERHLERVLVAWRDRTSLVASRTQLRLSLRELEETGDPALRPRLQRILDDARDSVPTVRRIVLFDEAGQPVASSGHDGPIEPLDRAELRGDGNEPRFRGVAKGADGSLRVRYLGPLQLDDEHIGAIELMIDARELADAVTDYTGLGSTGETLVTVLEPDGSVAILNDVRHPLEGPPEALPDDAIDPALAAARGAEEVYLKRSIDYRGREVWAATRYLEDPGWGIVVKIDAAEEMAPVLELRSTMVRLGISLSALAIVTGTLLGLYFARPIRELAGVARRVRAGEHELRARVTSEDEIAELVETFNEMIEALLDSRHKRQ